MKKLIIPGLLIFVIFMSFGFSGNFQQDKPAKRAEKQIAEKAELQKKVTAVFKMHCAVSGCHKGKYPKKKLSLEEDKFFEAIVNVTSSQVDSLNLVDTKQPGESYLLMKVKGSEGIVESKMPVDAPPLIEDEIEVIEKWIQSLKVPAPDQKVMEKLEGEKKTLKKKKQIKK
ncbi:MAG: hypothetical protein JSW07_20555 [bacterium]|nr:MAG: hypothetical protein JSW07_20555 [bacterium]